MAVDIYIEGERIDIFDDETITINSSVQNVKDISKIFSDFSQSFSVPASANNNNIFKRYYNADVDGGFDARIRKDAVIDIDTLDFKRGKISLESVKIEENDPVHYSIVFYGDTVKIKDLLGDDKLPDLDWLDNFDHDYTDANVKTGLTTGLNFTVDTILREAAIVYPLISYKKQWYYDSAASTDTSTDTLTDIAYHASKTLGVSFTELRPAIKLELILDAITDKYGLTFTEDFFGTDLFKDIYVNIYNNESSELANGLDVYDTAAGTFTVLTNQYKYRATVTPDGGFTTVPYKIRMYNNDVIIYESASWLTGTNQKEAKISVDIDLIHDYNVKAEIITEVDFEFSVDQRLKEVGLFFDNTLYNTTYAGRVIDLNANITTQIKDIKVYDFLVGLFKMFNLVVTPDGDDLYINDLQSWYETGNIYDVTPYVDTKSETVKKSDIYNVLAFRFKESKSILATAFKNNNNISYGNLEQKLEDDSGELINGTTLNIDSIFENPIFERLFDTNGNTETTIQYGLMADENLNSQVGEPFLMYLPKASLSANSIGWNPLTGYEEITTSVFMPSHSQLLDEESFSLNFNAEINEYTSQVFLDTLYQRFYADYIGDIFSVKRRLYDFKSILPIELKNKLKLNDRLIIRDRRYIINSITTNLTTLEENLELINDIYDVALDSDISENNTLGVLNFRDSNMAIFNSLLLTGKM